MDTSVLAAPLPSTGQALHPNLAAGLPMALPITLNIGQSNHYQKMKALKVMALLADQQ